MCSATVPGAPSRLSAAAGWWTEPECSQPPPPPSPAPHDSGPPSVPAVSGGEDILRLLVLQKKDSVLVNLSVFRTKNLLCKTLETET